MIYLFFILIGLCFGSFVNALVWRLHEQEGVRAAKNKSELSILRGRSMCPNCRHTLAGGDLLPVLSWVSLGGKCRYCRKPISWQYPLVESITAAMFVLSYIFWPANLNTAGVVGFAFWLVFLVGFMALLVSDIRWMILPDKIVYTLLGVAIVRVVVLALIQHDWRLFVGGFWGWVVLGGLFYVLFQVSGGKWIGGGDVKLGFVLGVLLGGPSMSLFALFLSSVLGTAYSLPLIILGKANRSSRVPYGPFLIVAAIITTLFGERILDWYQTLFLFG